MKTKKDHSTTLAKSPVRAIFNYVETIKSEFNKVTWTSKEELQFYTKVAVSSTFVCGMLVYFSDVVFKTSLESINVLLRMIGG